MKAGAHSSVIANIECALANIPLMSGYSPKCWRHRLDVMILKKSGLTMLNSLRSVALFPADCNYVFKQISRVMMYNAEKANALALEQYRSCKCHRATALAMI